MIEVRETEDRYIIAYDDIMTGNYTRGFITKELVARDVKRAIELAVHFGENLKEIAYRQKTAVGNKI